MRLWGTLLLLLSCLLGEPEAEARPLCKDAWHGSDGQFRFGEPYEAYYKRVARQDCEKEWAVLVYMAADNNLFPFALWDLYEMEAAYKSKERAGSTLKTDLLVQVDGSDPNDLRRLHIFSGPVEWAEKQKSDFLDATLEQVKSPVVARLQEKGTESERLTAFLQWATEAYPARHTMLVVWGHGQGWKAYPIEEKAKSTLLHEQSLPAFPRAEPNARFGGIAFRESSGTSLDIPSLTAALASFQRSTGKELDVYASDACLMQMLEVAHELSPHARFIAGSAQVQSFLGLPYRRMMYELNTGHFSGLKKENKDGVDSTDEPYLLAKMLPALMRASLDPKRGLQGKLEREAQETITSSSINSIELDRLLVPEIARLSAALRLYLKEKESRILELKFITQNVPTFEGGAQDFGIFLGFLDQLLLEERASQGGELSRGMANLQAAVANTKKALDRAVPAYSYGTAYGIDKQSQLLGYVPRATSVWLPVSKKEYWLRREEFAASRFWKATRWADWLDLLFPL